MRGLAQNATVNFDYATVDFQSRGAIPHRRHRHFIATVMSISREQIAHIAHLARLATEPAEAIEYAAQLSRILELVEQMNRIDTTGVAPLAHPQELAEAALRLRDDSVTEADRREDFQRLAPAAEDGLYLVPRVIE